MNDVYPPLTKTEKNWDFYLQDRPLGKTQNKQERIRIIEALGYTVLTKEGAGTVLEPGVDGNDDTPKKWHTIGTAYLTEFLKAEDKNGKSRVE